jgi:tRNA G10  N-methylase Trm11
MYQLAQMKIDSNTVSNMHESPQLSGIICYVPFINSITNLDCFIGMKQLPNECIDLVVTDPPYGMNFSIKSQGSKA